LQKGSAAYYRKHRDGGLAEDQMIGDVMHQREECLVQASMCREKAQADPVRNDYWIDQAIVWLQRAMQSRRANPVTHESDPVKPSPLMPSQVP
jgi:hypothetical protein